MEHHPPPPKSRDYALLIISLWAFTASPILIRYSSLPATDVVTGRLLLSLIILLPLWLAQKGHTKLRLFLSPPMLAAGLMLGVHFVLWTVSLHYTSVASASVAVCVSPIFVVTIERLFLGRKLRRETFEGLLLAWAGVVLLLADDLRTQQHGAMGVLIALLAALLSAIYILIGENARKTHRLLDYCVPVYLIGMLVSASYGCVSGNLPWKLANASGKEWLVLAGLAVLPTILGHTAFNYILRTFSAQTLSIAGLIEPFLATIAAYYLFGEQPTLLVMMGGIISVIGVYWVLWGQKSLVALSDPQT